MAETQRCRNGLMRKKKPAEAGLIFIVLFLQGKTSICSHRHVRLTLDVQSLVFLLSQVLCENDI
ncbi:hypothetical protein SG74_08530 [Enterobacter hormaechei subsp. xiangfangensis]|nr:hypothetical protein SG74_08530 [Enterobacter hormaechei subsp. xiangfangensis]